MNSLLVYFSSVLLDQKVFQGDISLKGFPPQVSHPLVRSIQQWQVYHRCPTMEIQMDIDTHLLTKEERFSIVVLNFLQIYCPTCILSNMGITSH